MKLGVLLVLNAMLICAIPARSQTQSVGPKDTFAASRLSAKEIRDVVGEVEQSAYDTPDSWQEELRVKRVDLGTTPGLIVRGSNLLCGGTGNCQTWVFRKTEDKLVSLFPRDHVAMAEGFRLGPQVTGGIKDFTVLANSGAESGQTVTYKFDGKFYRAK